MYYNLTRPLTRRPPTGKQKKKKYERLHFYENRCKTYISPITLVMETKKWNHYKIRI